MYRQAVRTAASFWHSSPHAPGSSSPGATARVSANRLSVPGCDAALQVRRPPPHRRFALAHQRVFTSKYVDALPYSRLTGAGPFGTTTPLLVNPPRLAVLLIASRLVQIPSTPHLPK
jgi:hypothetical protein